MMFVTLIDPDARSVVTLFPSAKAAFRLTAPSSAKGVGFAFPSLGGELRPGAPGTKTHDLGKKVIDGIEFTGTRTEPANQMEGSVVSFTERWYSNALGLTGSLVVVDTNGRHSVALKNIRRSEPDRTLFVIPSEYVVQDFKGFSPR